MTSLHTLDPLDGRDVLVVIETPKGSQNKFAFDPERNAFMLSGVLPAGAVFPFDFGFIPSSLGDDGDPLDVLVLMDAPAFAGCVVGCRLIGAIEARQGRRGRLTTNNRLLGVASKSRTHRSLRDITDVTRDLVAEIEHFFVSYNDAKGKTFAITRRAGRRRAAQLLRQGLEKYAGRE